MFSFEFYYPKITNISLPLEVGLSKFKYYLEPSETYLTQNSDNNTLCHEWISIFMDSIFLLMLDSSRFIGSYIVLG